MTREKKAVMAAIATALAVSVGATEYFVAPDGNDRAPGAQDRPFRTIQRAADLMVAGDTCYVRAGTYRETVRPKNAGAEGRPLRFVAWPGETVTLSGADVIEGTWRVHEGSISRRPSTTTSSNSSSTAR